METTGFELFGTPMSSRLLITVKLIPRKDKGTGAHGRGAGGAAARYSDVTSRLVRRWAGRWLCTRHQLIARFKVSRCFTQFFIALSVVQKGQQRFCDSRTCLLALLATLPHNGFPRSRVKQNTFPANVKVVDPLNECTPSHSDIYNNKICFNKDTNTKISMWDK